MNMSQCISTRASAGARRGWHTPTPGLHSLTSDWWPASTGVYSYKCCREEGRKKEFSQGKNRDFILPTIMTKIFLFFAKLTFLVVFQPKNSS